MIDINVLDGCVIIDGVPYATPAAREIADTIHAAARQAEYHQRSSERVLRDLIASIGDDHA